MRSLYRDVNVAARFRTVPSVYPLRPLAAIPRMLPASILNLHTFHGQGRRSQILTPTARLLSCVVRGSMDGPRQARRAARVAGRRAQVALGQDAEVARPRDAPDQDAMAHRAEQRIEVLAHAAVLERRDIHV